jgi:cation:H+ antiporter
MIASTVILIPLALFGGISSFVGILMVIVLALFTYYVIKSGKKTDENGNKIRKEKGSARKEFLYCCILLLGVLIAGNFTVQFAIETARLAGVSEWLIGSTIVAAGTSMPETVVSIISARKKQMGMSLGNIVGSNYFNVFWILGVSAMIKPLSFTMQAVWFDIVILSVITALFFAALMKRSISRFEGCAYLVIYAFFVFYLLGIVRF